MDIKINPGLYVMAVSGGVDSMTLLDILRQKAGVELVVAHFNHGIRHDSAEDEKTVAETAQKHRLKLEVGYGLLGVDTSEDEARKVRYAFLRKVKSKHPASTIVTAHHQDDLIETAFLNLLRGTGTRGLISISDNREVVRPLLSVSKKQILRYAKDNRLKWNEDSTNNDLRLLRNYIRVRLLPSLKDTQRAKLVKNIDKVAKIEKQKQSLIATISQTVKSNNKINRNRFTALPTEVADELILYWLRQLRTSNTDRKTIRRLNLTLKTGLPGTNHSVRKGLWLSVGRESAHFTTRVPHLLV